MLQPQEKSMANEDPIWRDLDNINGHKIYMNKKSISDTAIIVNSVFAAKMKNTRIRRNKHYMTLAAKVDNQENIYLVSVHAPTSWSGAAAFNDMLEEFRTDIEKEKEGSTNLFILIIGDMNTEWPQEIWREEHIVQPEGSEQHELPWEWMPRHPAERQAALMDFVRNMGLRSPRWAGEDHEKPNQWIYKARNGNLKHLDLQFASEVVDRPPICEWSRSDHGPIPSSGEPDVEFRLAPVALLWRWMPTPAEVAALATRWASWTPATAADVQRELAEAAKQLIDWPQRDAKAG